MKKFKITDGIIRKIEKRLLKVAKKEYGKGIYVVVDGIEIDVMDIKEYSIDMKVRWGREESDGKVAFQHETIIWLTDGNPNFIAGQFLEKIIEADGNE